MNDTPAHVWQRQREMLMRRTGGARLRMGSAMFAVARRLMRASLGDPLGTDRSAEMRVRLFLRTYGQDFDAATRDRLAALLRARAGGVDAGRDRSAARD